MARLLNGKEFLAYSASAGSGKTYALALRYIALLFLEQNPSEILAATFTKKAANEMRQRVLKLLGSLEREEGFVNSLVQEYGLEREYILANQKRVLERFLKSQNHIVTLDSFFSSILRSCALQIGLEPDFAIKDRGEELLEESFLKRLEQENQTSSLVKLSVNLHKRNSEDVVSLLSTLFT
ncbi:MAG TPA: RecB-like helicase, partial [Nitratifractor sp.]|nr:RecB-like helicase [Nitratifractor sp.]